MNSDKWMKEGIASILRKAPTPVDRFPAEWKRAYVRDKIRERAQEIPRPKVFGIGLSKTGTTSLAFALEHLGYETVSWARNGRILGWPEFYLADAATDTPCCTQFEALYHTFEDAKFIYTVRDKEDWTRSIKTHFDLESPREFRRFWGSENFWNGNTHWKWAPDWAWQNPFRFMQIHESLYAQHETWQEAYDTFDCRVQHFFENKPDNRILTMNIPGGDGWRALCSFLDKEIPGRSFPHANKSASGAHQ